MLVWFLKNMNKMIKFVKNKKMNREEIIPQLKNLIQPYVKNLEAFETLSENTDFINDLKINSANLIDVILDIEEKFDIEIDNDSMEKMMDVKSALDIIETKLASK
jgi:acyl carrier protein